MIVNNPAPTISRPFIVQVNYDDGDIGFYQAEDIAHAKSFAGKIVAIFKPNNKIKK